MASAEAELEDRLQEVGNRLASPPSAVEDLLTLLDQTESFLSRVDQSPSQSMSAALRPTMKALVSKELLEHSNMDVKVAVASCISEITRITAPDAPYDDDLMKVIFQMIVEAFGQLDDTYSRSYPKRISILETVAKVRSCVVMLDLECDALILEMFHHFLKTIRLDHPENVFSSMETIMTLVLEESEDIPSELLSSLLDSVKKDKEVQPSARRLGEKVIGNCAAKLKPYLMEVVQSLCAREYSKIVASICQENSDALEHTEINVSGEILADDSKLSERTVSDELPQGSVKLEQEVGSLEKDGTADKSPRSTMSNGVVETGDGDSVVEPSSPKLKPERSRRGVQLANNIASERSNSDNLESMAVKSDSLLDLKTKKTRGRKATPSVQLTDTADRTQNDDAKEVSNSQMDGLSGKEAESGVSLEPDEKNDLQPTPRSDNGTDRISSPTPSASVLDAGRPKRGRPKVSAKRGFNAIADQLASPSGEKGSQTKDESLPSEDNDSKKEHEAISNSEGKSLRRRGKKVHSENVDDGVALASVTSDSEGKSSRRVGKKVQSENVVDGVAPASVTSDSEGKSLRRRGKKVHSENVDDGVALASVTSDSEGKSSRRVGKKVQSVNVDDGVALASVTSDSEGKSSRRLGKKVHSENVDDGVVLASVTSDTEGKQAGQTSSRRSTKKVIESGSPLEQQKSNIKQSKREATIEKDAAGELSLKVVTPTPKSGTKVQSKDQKHLEDNIKTQSRRKRARGTDEISEETKLNQDLVGSKIQVWWPDDEKFYSGKVDAFDPVSGKHTIVYDDGDLEVLLLKDEDYKLVEGDSETDGGKAIDILSSTASPEVRRDKKAKANSDSVPTQAITEVTPPLKSGTESSNEPKRKGRPKGRPSSLSGDSAKSPKKSREKDASISKDDSLKTSSNLKGPGSKSKDETSDAGDKDDPPKSGSELEDAPPKRRRSKGNNNTPRSSSKPKDGTPKAAGKSVDDSVEDDPKTATNSRVKSKEDAPKTTGTPKLPKPKGGGVTPKAGGVAGSSEKGKGKVPDSETTAGEAQESEGASGKRKRRGKGAHK